MDIELKKINDFVWEIPKSGPMKVPAVVYSSEKLLKVIKKDQTLEQLRNVACLKGIQNKAYAMPDAHQGYGFPIGGVAAFDMDEGIISPGGVGFDINCGVKMLTTQFYLEQIKPKIKQLINEIFNNVPVGVGRKSDLYLERKEFNEMLENGLKWALSKGYCTKDDMKRTEEEGCIEYADPSKISERAYSRGKSQLCTLGAGNHFIEIQKVDEIYDVDTAKKFGIEKENQICFTVHCGSRGFGHQIASDYIKKMESEYGFENLPDRQLINAPIKSKLGQDYLKAMSAAANFGFVNRQIIAHRIRKAFEKVFGIENPQEKIRMLYGICHNIAKIEEHIIDGKTKNLCVHRKGATRSFGPGRKEIPEVYRDTGQPVLIPGTMGTASYILVGTKKAEEMSFGSSAHGAGRVMSRNQAKREFRAEEIQSKLKQEKDIELKGASFKGIAEESPGAYKDIDEVIKVTKEAGLAKPVARVVPVAVIKG
ncbi:RtcB family protein [Candidatus Woesearchaeota archaeon]|nr:RtcB family protein [Candidatus Woesearchaeota archaeon]